MQKDSTDKLPSLHVMLEAMPSYRLGTLAFNVSAIAWIGLNVSIKGFSPGYAPCNFLHPNFLNILSGALLLYSIFLAISAVKKGSLFPAVITFTFVWSLIATVIRHLST
jgi:hypothetical protein